MSAYADAWNTLVLRKGSEDWHHETAHSLANLLGISYEEGMDMLMREGGLYDQQLSAIGHGPEKQKQQRENAHFLADDRDYDLWEETMPYLMSNARQLEHDFIEGPREYAIAEAMMNRPPGTYRADALKEGFRANPERAMRDMDKKKFAEFMAQPMNSERRIPETMTETAITPADNPMSSEHPLFDVDPRFGSSQPSSGGDMPMPSGRGVANPAPRKLDFSQPNNPFKKAWGLLKQFPGFPYDPQGPLAQALARARQQPKPKPLQITNLPPKEPQMVQTQLPAELTQGAHETPFKIFGQR